VRRRIRGERRGEAGAKGFRRRNAVNALARRICPDLMVLARWALIGPFIVPLAMALSPGCIAPRKCQ